MLAAVLRAHRRRPTAQLKVLADATYRADGPGDQAARRPRHQAARGPGVPRPQRRARASSCSTRATTCCRTARRPGRCWPSGSDEAAAFCEAVGDACGSDIAGGHRAAGPRSALRWPASPAPWPPHLPARRGPGSGRAGRGAFRHASAAPSPCTERALAAHPATMSPRTARRRRREPPSPCAGTRRPFGDNRPRKRPPAARMHRQRAAAPRRAPAPRHQPTARPPVHGAPGGGRHDAGASCAAPRPTRPGSASRLFADTHLILELARGSRGGSARSPSPGARRRRAQAARELQRRLRRGLQAAGSSGSRRTTRPLVTNATMGAPVRVQAGPLQSARRGSRFCRCGAGRTTE